MNYLARRAKKIFVDSLTLKVRGGKGGHGLPQYGGIGGKGGDVYVVGSERPCKLEAVRKLSKNGVIQAGDGQASRRTQLLGEAGKDQFIPVPVGVSIEDMSKQAIGTINRPSDQILVAVGGRGGDKSTDNHGFVGQTRSIRLDLKMISDAVFVGFPNAGKSSLLRAVSRATPQVANYPFTTLRPYLGHVSFPDHRVITMADLPGLVEGAHKNMGLGHEFLKHMVHTRILVFLIDINDIDLGPSYPRRSPLETILILNREMELYDETLLQKPSILVCSKMDTMPDANTRYEKLLERYEELRKSTSDVNREVTIDEAIRPKNLIRFDAALPVSSRTGHNIEEFKSVVRETIDEYAEMERSRSNIPRPKSFQELLPSEYNRIVNEG